LEVVKRASASGVEMIQIRAKQLPARELLRLSIAAVKAAGSSRVLVNSRFDIARAAGAQGVHLPAHSVAPSRIRSVTPQGFLIGVSCHTLDEILEAEREQADFVVYAPIFPTRSKPEVSPLGLDALRAACSKTTIPIYALGGITEANAPSCLAAGAFGVAGISLWT
jgi:thiamine-phosphate pyrophosphorylase